MSDRKTLPDYIKPATPGKESGAFIIDFLMVVILALILRLVVGQYVFAPAMGYNEVVSSIQDYAVESGLYVRNGGDVQILSYSGETDIEKYDHYVDYADAVWTYYFDVCASSSHPDFSLTDYEGEDDAQAKGQYIYHHFYGIDETVESGELYQIAKNELDQLDYSLAPVLTEETKAKLDSEEPGVALDIRKSLYQYFFDGNKGLYPEAANDFVRQAPVAKLLKDQSRIVYMSTLPAYVISPLIFLLIIPMISKKGKTLGKMFLRLSLVRTNGYKAALPYRALHGFLLMMPFGLLMLPISGAWVYLVLIGAYLIDLIVLMLNPKKNSIHGMLSFTQVIDDRVSPETFADEEEEKEYAASHDDETARAIKSENGHPSEATEHGGERYINGRRAVIQSEYAEMEIVNLDTIGSARREAANISSFDQFEEDKAKQMENNRVVKAEEEKPVEAPVEAEPAPEEPTEEDIPEEKPEEEPKEPVDPNDDGFLDDPKDKEKEE